MRRPTPSSRWRSLPVRATMKPRGNYFGRVHYARLSREDDDITLIITLAGLFAQKRVARPMSAIVGCAGDIAFVEKKIYGRGSNIPEAERDKALAYVARRSEEAVDYCWEDIKVVAKALLEHQTMTGDEILAVIREARRKDRRRIRTGDEAFAA
jgi:hypothetical protein